MTDTAVLTRPLEATSSANAMRRLGSLTDALKDVIPPGARVGYVDYPMHINVGDLLIYLGAVDFFRANNNAIATSFCVFDASWRAFSSLVDCDVIVCHGGGNFGDIYGKHQRLREQIVRAFPDKPVVVMPQSFHFGSSDALADSAAIFRQHPNVTIAVRDRESHDIARRHFTDRVMLVPDMAHRLYDGFDRIRRSPVVSSELPLRLMRRDVEAAAPATATASTYDWSDLVRPLEKASIGRHRIASMLAGRLDTPNPGIMPAHHRTVAPIIDNLALRLIAHRNWITSRLHGAIFGLLLDRSVELHDNSYGKNSRYFNQWGADLANLTIR